MINNNPTKPSVQELKNLSNSGIQRKYDEDYKKKQLEIYTELRKHASEGLKEAHISYISNHDKKMICAVIEKEYPELRYQIKEDDVCGYDPHDIGASYVIVSGW